MPLTEDRELGAFWEKQFCKMMLDDGFGVHRFAKEPSPVIYTPEGHIILVDVWLLERAGAQFLCEIKHKSPTKDGTYGLEEYRLDSLIRLQAWMPNANVSYVIHNHQEAGGKGVKENNITHWHAASISELKLHGKSRWSPSYVAGAMKTVPVRYWPTGRFTSLETYLSLNREVGR